MIVKKIITSSFGRQDSATIELPPTGVVTVTGKNGHGKSTIVEAVAQGGWNETVRGAPGWRKEGRSGVDLEFEGGRITRASKNGKQSSLKWHTDTSGAAEYPTATKSQHGLEAHIGTHHVWHHACTFHTDESGRFAKATDANRKRLLEEVLELDRVEKGYRNAREELNVERRMLEQQSHEIELLEAKLAGINSKSDLLGAELEEVPDLDALRAREKELREAIEGWVPVMQKAQGALMKALATHGEHVRESRRLTERTTKFENMQGECPTCEQDVVGGHCEAILSGTRLVAKDTQDAIDIAQTDLETRTIDAEAIGAENDEFTRLRQEVIAEGKAAVAAQKRNESKAATISTVHTEAVTAQTKLDTLLAKHAEQEIKVGELEAVVMVLSFQGVRASLLAGAVKALQDLACDWLSKLGMENLTIEMSSQTENKAGKVSDTISFIVHGAGGGHGYKGCSTGERRRIDIAMLFALGELASDSRGISPQSTLFIDEVFDGLDVDGREAVVAMLNEISKDRCVVVITHSKSLLAELTADMKIVATDGKLSVV